MLKNTIVQIDDTPLNTAGGIQIWQNIEGQSDGVSVSTSLRTRARDHAALESVSYNPRNQSFLLRQDDAGVMSFDDFNYMVQALFLPSHRERTITVQVDTGVQAYNTALVTSFRRNSVNEWEGVFQFRDPIWKYSVESSETLLTVTTDGDLPVRPKVKIIAGQAITRQRFMVSDNTGHSIRAYPIRFVPSAVLAENNYRVFANNVEIPFNLVGGALFFRVSAPVRPKNTRVDVYHGASINNTIYAGQMNAAGMTLDSGVATGTVTVTTEDASANPLAPNLAWHPSISVRHPTRRDYSFGIEDGQIKLISNDTAEDLNALENDADSFVIVSSTEIDSISNLNLVVSAGYQPGTGGDANESSSNRQMMRVMMKTLRGGSKHHATWTLGVGPLTRTYNFTHTSESSSYVYERTVWSTFAEIGQFDAQLRSLSGVTVTGGNGTWYLDFPFKDPKVPLMTMSLQPRDILKTKTKKDVDPPEGNSWPDLPPARPSRGIGTREASYRGTREYEIHDVGKVPVVIFQADWVDPETKRPFKDDEDNSNLTEDPIRGRTRVVIKYRRRGDPRWITAWSRTVTGTAPSGRTTSFSGISADTPGAVEIAIGLEPVGARQTLVDWGTLEVASVPTLSMDVAKMPSITTTTPVNALHLNGTLHNTRNDKWVRFTDFLSDDNGVEIDIAADHPVIQGVDGVGVVNGVIEANGREIPFILEPGINTYSVSDDLETATLIETVWRERLIF